jgi:hypothetical protein
MARSGGAPSIDGQSSAAASAQLVTGFEIGRSAFLALRDEQRIAVQTELRELDLYKGRVDGQWGRGTYAAVKGYLSGKDETENNFRTAYTTLSEGANTTSAQNSEALITTTAEKVVTAQSDQGLTTLEAAQSLVADVEAFVASGRADFDISFAKKYAAVSDIKNGKWDKGAEDRISDFQKYVFASESFRQYRAALELERTTAQRAEAADLKSKISTGSDELIAWVQKNLLDPQSAVVVEVVETAQKTAGSDDIELLRTVAAQIELTKAKAGILQAEDAAELVGNSSAPDGFTSDAIYILGNFSGNGEHIYKGLSGNPEFDSGNASACVVGMLDQWEKYSLSNVLAEKFSVQSIELKTSDCRGTEDIVVAKGAELQSKNTPASYKPRTLEEIAVIEQNAVFEAKSKLEIASELYETDIMNGSKVGHGLVIFNGSTAALCLVLDDNKDDHLVAIEANKKVLSNFVEFTGGYALASDAIDAFKRIQRNECGSIYASAETLAQLIEAAKNNELKYLVAPVWVTPSALEQVAQQRESNERAAAAQREAQEQNEALREQASASASQKALARQQDLQNRYNVRFSALVDDLSGKLRTAVEFGLGNSPLDKGYSEKYSALTILDPIDQSQSPFDAVIEDVQGLALEKWEMTGLIVEKIDYGDVSYNGRTLEGIVTELKVSLKNRVVGDFGTYCRVVRAVQDDDFDMLRQISIEDCGADHSDWKLENGFSSKWIVEPG